MSLYFTPISSLYHYYKMAKGNYREYLQGPVVWIKKYFYVLRPLLAINWIERDLGVVPTAFQLLVEKTIDSPELKWEITDLITAKRGGEELDRGPRIALISDFIEGELRRLETRKFEHEFQNPTAPVQDFDSVFRSALDEVWARQDKDVS
jgi:predicted nucleotidyltransferase